MHILLSPNAFKNSLDGYAAAHALEAGLQLIGHLLHLARNRSYKWGGHSLQD